jgi:hypothetical protein
MSSLAPTFLKKSSRIDCMQQDDTSLSPRLMHHIVTNLGKREIINLQINLYHKKSRWKTRKKIVVSSLN